MKSKHKRKLQPVKPKRKAFIAIPSYGGQIEIAGMRSLMFDVMHLVQAGWEMQIFEELGHADVYSLRAQLCMHFLDTDATDLVMIDNDLSWEAGSLVRLLSHEVDVVGGSYPKRKDPITFMFRSAEFEKTGILRGHAQTGMIPVDGLPGGFMRIQRHVIEKLHDKHRDELEVIDPHSPQGKTVRIFDPYFYDAPDGRHVLSEDYAFCQRWRDMDGMIWMDSKIAMAHHGAKAFYGQIGQWMDDNMQQTDEAA